MKNLFGKSLLLAACLVLSIFTYASAVEFNGYLDDGTGLDGTEYSNSFTAGWYNGHDTQNSRYKPGTLPSTSWYIPYNQTTTVRWEYSGSDLYLYTAVPITAKYMFWAPDGNAAYTPDDKTFYGGKNKMNYKDATHSEMVVFWNNDNNTKDGEVSAYLRADRGSSNGVSDITLDSYASSLDFIINKIDDPNDSEFAGCSYGNDNNSFCDKARDIPMSFEFLFKNITNLEKESLLSGIEYFGLEFHLSPEGYVAESAPVPEPATLLLLGSGLLGLAVYRRKSKK